MGQESQWRTSGTGKVRADPGFGCLVSSFGFRVLGCGFRPFVFRVSSIGSRVSILGFQFSDFGFRFVGFLVSRFGSRVSGFRTQPTGESPKQPPAGSASRQSSPRTCGPPFRLQGVWVKVVFQGLSATVEGAEIWGFEGCGLSDGLACDVQITDDNACDSGNS